MIDLLGKTFVAFLTVFVIAALCCTNGLAYISGILNSNILLILALVLFFPMLLIAIGCLVYQVYVAFHYWANATYNVKVISLTLIIFSIILLAGGVKLYKPWWIRHAEGFRVKMNQGGLQKHLPAIRQWLGEIGNKDTTYPKMVPPEKCPSFIKEFSSKRVLLVAYGRGADMKEAVSIFWGGGFIGAWGVTIGPANMETPQSSEREYILPLAPGVFVWHSEQ